MIDHYGRAAIVTGWSHGIGRHPSGRAASGPPTRTAGVPLGAVREEKERAA
jgi:hypothetical protein